MKNLIPLTRKIYYWDNIVDNKRPLATRTSLQAIRQNILNRFNAYFHHTNPNNLEGIPGSPFVAPNIALLESCYGRSNGISVLKTRINEKQNVLLRGECQYCNIGEPNTFDHYLPQTDFPEFSALSINLIPCCSKCNTEKGEEWLLLGNRKIINYYYDTLPNIQYLSCTIIYRGVIPQAVFALNSGVIPINLRPIIENHFSALKLFERYKLRSNSEIVDVFNSISPYAGILSRLQIQTQLQGEAANMRRSKGDNYWRAVIRIALANSNAFLTSAGY
jgi:5-methylcytosine-specific restriction endonuclease McrA